MIHAYDHSRGYTLPSGTEETETRRRPIQVSMWYPSRQQEGDQPMPYIEYLGLSIGRDDFEGVSNDDRMETSRRIAARRIEKYGARIAPEDWLELQTGAVLNAPPAEGSFPLVLYAPGFSQPAFDNSLVCEILASHGYVVLSAPSAGHSSQAMTEDLIGIEAQVRDLEYLVALAHDLPFCDTDRIGSFGWSWGGISVVLQQMRNSYIDAVISYDGSLEWNPDLVQKATHFDATRMTVPYLYACQAGMDDKELPFFDALEDRNALLLRFHELTHGEFGSYRALLQNGFPEAFEYDTRSYEALCTYTLQFFDAHLTGSRAAKSFLSRGSEDNGIPAEILTIERDR